MAAATARSMAGHIGCSPGGGGIQNDNVLTATNSTVVDNAFGCGEGGGISNLLQGTLTVTNTTITGNATTTRTCGSAGGGIGRSYGRLMIAGSIAASNTSYPQAPIGPDIDRLYAAQVADTGGNLYGGTGLPQRHDPGSAPAVRLAPHR